MKTTTADDNAHRCPDCDDELTGDPSGKGYVRHKTNRDCDYQRGEKDLPTPQPPSTSEQTSGN